MSDILNTLNKEQKEAVKNTEGPLLILAGAGSGKTKVLTHKIAYLIGQCGVPSTSILAVTFTNKAAQEMKERLRLLLKKIDQKAKDKEPTVATFHSICLQILRREIHFLGRQNNFVVFDTVDQVSLIRTLIKKYFPDTNFTPKSILSKISAAKGELTNYDDLLLQSRGDFFLQTVAQIYPLYDKQLRLNEALDFDDLLKLTVQLFQKFPQVLSKYRERWQYLLIDEYQDTNNLQYNFSKLLAPPPEANICVVGDDDQSIYAFRGANVSNILDFEQDYPQAKVIKLEQNYRSTQNILEAAYSVIRHNQNRKDKKLWTQKTDNPTIKIHEAITSKEEAQFVINQVKKNHEIEKHNYSTMAVLYRTNAQSRVFEEICLQQGVPYFLVGGVKFYERKEVKDILAALRFIHNPEDRLSLQRIINTPPRGIGKTSMKFFFDLIEEKENILKAFESLPNLDKEDKFSNPRAVKPLQKFYDMYLTWLDSYKKDSLDKLFDIILQSTGYIDYIIDGTKQSEDRVDNIQELKNSLESYKKYGPQHSLTVFLEEVALMTDLDTIDKNIDALTLITTHAVKGLEFDTVFLTGLEEGILPHSRSLLNTQDISEERRLCYVGLTRAKKNLFLTHALSRSLWGETKSAIPSRFLSDIPSEIIEEVDLKDEKDNSSTSFYDYKNRKSIKTEAQKHLQKQSQHDIYKVGQNVEHKTFGSGKIVQIKGDELTIVFAKNIKRLLASLAPLKEINYSEE